MKALGEKLRRLGEMSAGEIRFRTAQKLRQARERWAPVKDGAGRDSWWEVWDASKVRNQALAEALRADRAEEAAQLLPEYFTVSGSSEPPRFFFSASERSEIVAAYPRMFPERAKQLRNEAEALCAHRFRIFAYSEVSAGTAIPWRRDLVHGVESGDAHASRIPYLDFLQAGDSKIVWEPNRHQHFFTLGQAWTLTAEERFAEECLAQFEHWRRANPYPRGINWASSLEAAFRAWSWLWTLELLCGSPALTGARIGAITQALAEHAGFIVENLSTYFSPNTHLLGEGFALFAIGLLLPELRGAAAWRDLGRGVLLEQMERQVRPDGAHVEQSSCYHRYATDFFLCAAILAERNGCAFPSAYRERLERMAEFSLETAWPSGKQPMAGDADGGQLLLLAPRDPNDHRPMLSTAAVFFRRGDFARAAGRFHEETLWLLGAGAAEAFQTLEQAPPGHASRVFPDAGAVVIRSGWDARARFLFFDAGPQGLGPCAHGHADALSILCAADGVEWLVDPGTFVYTPSRLWRHFFRSTAAHTTLAVDGRDQAEPADSFKWRGVPQVRLERAWTLGSLDAAVASHNGYAQLTGGAHRRAVVFVKPDYWLIADTVEGDGAHRLEFFFHFAAGVELVPGSAGAMASKGPERFCIACAAHGANYRIIQGAESPIQGWYSEDYGQRVSAPVLVAEMYAGLPARALWLLWPGQAEQPRLRSSSEDGARGVRATVETRTWTDHFALRSSEDHADTQGLSTDAELAYLRNAASGCPVRLVVASGCCVDWAGQPLLRAESWLDEFEAEWHGEQVDIRLEPVRRLKLRAAGAKRARVNGSDAAARIRGDFMELHGEQ